MKKLNVHETKTHLSRYIPAILNGETILLCKRNVPFAEIRPLPKVQLQKRIFGLAKGTFELDDKFFDPLDESLIKAFEGDDVPSENKSSKRK